MNDPSIIKVNSERAQYWLGVGAQPTSAVTAILKVTGDWQTFKGLPGTEGTLRVAEPKVAKVLVFEAAVQEAAKEPKTPARKPKLDVAVDAPKSDVAEAVEAVDVAEAVEVAETVEAVETVEVADAIAAEATEADTEPTDVA